MNIEIEKLIPVAIKAGEEILEIYKTDFDVEIKGDNSPLTIADKKSNAVIIDALNSKYPDIPIISEENKLIAYDDRKHWDYCWMVDPLDGTKEFIKKNGEFTVNIALIHKGVPIAGIVHVPATKETFYAQKNKGAFKITGDVVSKIKISPLAQNNVLRIVGSRSHGSPELETYVDNMKSKFHAVEFVATGSSLKFCILAEGKADVYPRLGPTMEWDTAAGQIVAMEAGAIVNVYNEDKPLLYNKENLLNPYFIVKHPDLQ